MSELPFTKHSVALHSVSPEQLLEVVRGARLEHYILTRSKCNAWLERWSMGNFTVDVGRYSFPVRIVGAFSAKRMCVGYMRRLTDRTWVNGFEADQNTMEFYPAGAELNYRAAPNGEWVAIEFTEEALQAAARSRLGHEVTLSWKHMRSFQVSKAERGEIDRLVRGLWCHPVSGTLMVEPILGALAQVLQRVQRATSAVAPPNRLRVRAVLRQSDEYLCANLANHFDLRALAGAVGTTPRTLERLFARAYGVTPQRWARCFALHHARKRLRTADWHLFTVEGIANECGFQHMGRFAGYYAELFGEPPSATLIGGRAAA